MSKTKMTFLHGVVLVCAPLIVANIAVAGTIILEGSDAIGYHCPGGDPSACVYTAQVWKALDGSSALPIAVIEGSGGPALNSQGSGITIDNFTSVAAAGTLSNYAALYFEGDAGDDAGPEGDTAIMVAGASSAVSAYLAGGGTIMIEDYTGGSAWDPIVGTTGGANGHVAGYLGGSLITSSECDDGETVTATGATNGFTQPAALGCWEHQAYDESYFGSLGFGESFFDAAPGMVSGATTGWSALLSDGSTLSAPPTGVPEPSSLLLLSAGFLGLGSAVFVKARR